MSQWQPSRLILNRSGEFAGAVQRLAVRIHLHILAAADNPISMEVVTWPESQLSCRQSSAQPAGLKGNHFNVAVVSDADADGLRCGAGNDFQANFHHIAPG